MWYGKRVLEEMEAGLGLRLLFLLEKSEIVEMFQGCHLLRGKQTEIQGNSTTLNDLYFFVDETSTINVKRDLVCEMLSEKNTKILSSCDFCLVGFWYKLEELPL